MQSQGSRFGRSQSKSKDRFKSKDRPKSELAKDVEEVKADVKEIRKLIVEIDKKMVKKSEMESNFVKEEYDVDVRYVNETEGLRMIVDSGVSMLIVSAGWLEKYLKEMEVD